MSVRVVTAEANKQSGAKRCTVWVRQALPLSIVVIGGVSAELSFLQHHIALKANS
jgi:hypothetical protein